MSNTEIRQEINQYLDRLSSERLQLVADFLALNPGKGEAFLYKLSGSAR